jgi:hypothetical protein
LIAERLARLLAEKSRRRLARTTIPEGQPFQREKELDQDDPAAIWKAKREQWAKENGETMDEVPAGEVANMLEGLTPDGYNRKGKRASFVEEGESVGQQERCLLISSTNLNIFRHR